MSFQGEWVWVNSEIGVPIGARVKVTPSGQHYLVDDEGKVNKGLNLVNIDIKLFLRTTQVSFQSSA